MSIVKTHAIPLYWTDVSNTSRIVTWLTAHFGKISTAIKGDQRKNSLFRGQYDHFSTSELLFYDRTERGTHIAKECSMLHPRPVFRTDWRACAAAGYIAALFAKTTPRHGHEPGRFELFEEMLGYAEEYGRYPAFLAWFDLKFAEFQGQAVLLEDAGQGSGVGGQGSEDSYLRPAKRFSAEHGGLINPGYAREHRIPSTPMAPEALALLIEWQQAPTPENVPATPCNPAFLRQIEHALEKFVTWQFDLPPHIRRTASGILHYA
ncbi:MAG: DNA repair protein RecO [Pontiellaceae bacterium]|jgi:recombinational DNA repair protein (RecF pathway)|nr:DNA repair protein RecO [Pontiellaceae bacterium]